MKPNRPHVVNSSRNHITVGWDSCDSLILKKIERFEGIGEELEFYDKKRWYVLQKKDRILGWCKAYMGFKTQSQIGPLAPGDFYEFRLKTKGIREESEWSDTLFAATKDDVIPIAQLHRVVENGPVTALRKILSQRISAIDVPNKQGLTALRLSLLKNNINFIGILLNHGSDVSNTELGSCRTPLMMAAYRGQLEAVQLLLEKGSAWETKDRNGLTALNYAVDNSHIPVIQLALNEGADVETKDRFGWSSLMRGVHLRSSVEVLSYLLENGSNLNEADNRGQTVLMQAVLSERPEVVELLIKKGADIRPRNIYNHSAYDLAKSSNNEEILKIAHLLESDKDEMDPKKKVKEKKNKSITVTSV